MAAKKSNLYSGNDSGKILTEDVWFRSVETSDSFAKWASHTVHVYGGDKDVKAEWNYNRGGDKLDLKVSFKIDALFGKDSGHSFKDVDISAYKDLFKHLGAKDLDIKVKVSDDKVDIKITGKCIELSDKDVKHLPKEMCSPVTVEDKYGCEKDFDLKVCVDKFKAHSPIAFDLNGDGAIGVTGTSTAQFRTDDKIGDTVWFDLDADGRAEQIEWLSGDGDGLLVFNRDGNAANDMNGARLFGDQGGLYKNGYEKLALLDDNRDGTINGPELTGLELWVDDGDAVVQQGELRTLSEYGINAIKVAYDTVYNENGEALIQSFASTATSGDMFAIA